MKFPSVIFMLFLLEQSIKSFQFILFLEENERMEKYKNMISAQLKIKEVRKNLKAQDYTFSQSKIIFYK